jgi:hypothetical protein
MNPYPKPFDPANYPLIPAAVAMQSKVTSKLKAMAPVEVQGALRVATDEDAAVTDLHIESVNDSSVRSQSFQNQKPGENGPVDASHHFYFLPGVDSVRIAFTVVRPALATKAKFELYSAQKTTPIWSKEYAGAEAVALAKGPAEDGQGTLAWNQVTVVNDPALFPDGCPTVAGAQYQLRLTVTGSKGAVTAAWTYFDVMVQKIELHWGVQSIVPPTPITDVLPIYQALTDRDEKALLAGLRSSRTTIDPVAGVELRLKSLNAAYVHLNEWYQWRDMSFLRYKGRWGAGPRLPIVARIFLKSIDTPEGVFSTNGARALGPAEFLWDWRDKTEVVRTNEMAAYDAHARSFILAALKYRENAAGEPPDCLNSHADRGGKRGGAQRVLPEVNSAPFPFQVARPGTRRWAAISKAATSGAWECSTGVLFQPSRMAMDSYQLRVFLAAGPYKATLDVGGTMDAITGDHPGLPTANTGMFEILRQVDAKYIRKGTNTPRADLDAVAAEYRKGGIVVNWTEDGWQQADYDNLMTQSVAPDNTGEDPGYVRHRVFKTNCTARRSGLTAWNNPVKAEIANYDQWFGCPAGQTLPQESAAQFTLPGRQVILNRFIAPVVANYIAKDRKVNDKKRKWQKFKRRNVGVADAVLQARFYNEVLTQEERDKLLPTIKNDYIAANWEGWDRPATHAEEWADDNYDYALKKLVYLSQEMHLRKVLADGFEGVTVFHYQHFFEALNPDGSVYARQCAIGGVAAISMNTDLGLSGAFSVWDHPTNLQRQTLKRTLCVRSGKRPQGASGHDGDRHGECTFKDGNSTIVHEFGHFLHLPHSEPTGGTDEVAMHDQNDDKCIMNYVPDALHLCGGCLLRLRGWAFFQSKGMLGFDNTDPANAGAQPPAPSTPGLDVVFPNFYPDFA